MTNPDEIRSLARQRLSEAEILYQNGKYDGAFYLAGYSVELTLKAKICERLGIPNLFDETHSDTNSIKGISEIRKTLKTHNLFTLLIFSGLKVKFDNDKATRIDLAKAISFSTKWYTDMDRTELKKILEPFKLRCAEKGKPLADICIKEAFPGDTSTSFIIQVKALWVDDKMYCSDAIDFLFDTLWETTTEEVRRMIFSIQVLDSIDQLHCWSDAPIATT